jgi:hypothetical protein
MTHIVLDDQISRPAVEQALARPYTAHRLRDIRPGQVIKDERVPILLRELHRPTFVTIDDDFWRSQLRDRRYCILFFPLDVREQAQIPGLLRRLLRLPEFRTRAARMGKVARVSPAQIDYWETGSETMQRLVWPERRRITPS